MSAGQREAAPTNEMEDSKRQNRPDEHDRRARRCYASWKRYENDSYEEKHCHTCGSKHAATLIKPLCGACYTKFKDLFKFVVG